MAEEEIGFRELRELVARSWKPIFGLAILCALTAAAVLLGHDQPLQPELGAGLPQLA